MVFACKTRRRGIAAPFLLLMVLLLQSGCTKIGYLIHVSGGQLSILTNQVSLHDEAELSRIQPPLSLQETDNLSRLQDILAFATHVGLNTEGQYQKLHRGDPRGTVWVLTASPVTAPVLQKWWFPIVGTVPYLGWFDKARAITEASELRADGWDVNVRPASAYSTLGWFDDPLFRAQLQLELLSFVEVVLHELVHATAWISGRADWNESAAQYTGERLLALWGAEKGIGADAWNARKAKIRDSDQLSSLMNQARQDLEGLYDDKGSAGYKDGRLAVVANFAASLSQQTWSVYDGVRLSAAGWTVPGILGAQLYDRDTTGFDDAWSSMSDTAAGEELARRWIFLLRSCSDHWQDSCPGPGL